ncbi:WXG100 family type VII secretion target [Mycolicibacterium neoaurum]|uniref:WXG100 family type VII secretion target n=1 Tax=Mycolicibacterium neoaurum TaxID=1795 RepID=UPI001F4C65DB|nr:WXG100 family type VII secretion target [Mycolicibacterium neoaurum]
MAQLEIDTAAVTHTAAAVASAASGGSSQGITVTPPASDPVSAAVAETLQARCSAIAGYSNFAQVITEARGSMLASSANTYDDQEQLSAASLGSGGGSSAAASPPPAAPIMSAPTVPTVTAPQIGAPPTNGKDISRLLHGGPGPAGLYSAAQQMRSHASQLQDAARQLQTGSTAISADWQSGAGDQASQRINELSQWYERHGEHATATATAMETHADNYARARANTPRPEEFEDTEQRLKRAAQANANPANMGRYAPVVATLQTELGGLHAKATAQYADYARSAANPSLVGAPLEPPPRPGAGGVQALDAPLSPAPKDDPQKYWLDLSKIVQKAPGELGPFGYKELTPGSGTWYPDPKIDSLHPGQFPSGPAQAPVDLNDIKQYAPGDLGPNGYQELIPDSGTWVPQPGRFPGVEDAPPQTPIDVRKLIQVPEGTLAPANTVQIAPGLWYPQSPGPR